MPAGSAAHDVMYGSCYLPKNRTDRRIAYVHIVYTTTIAGLSAFKEIEWEVLRLEGEKEGKGRLGTIPYGMLHIAPINRLRPRQYCAILSSWLSSCE